MAKAEDAQDLANFESDFTWDDVCIVDDTESLFFGGAMMSKI